MLLYNAHVMSYYYEQKRLLSQRRTAAVVRERDLVEQALIRELLHTYRAKIGENSYARYEREAELEVTSRDSA